MGTGPLQAQPSPSVADPGDPLIGKTLAGRYAIVRKLGEGGMGAVYLAMHQVLEKPIALKVLHGEFARKPDLVERFMQEAKAASRIRHENVIDISDFGTTPEGLVFFAMELLQGHDLHEDIARARLAGQLLPWSRSKKIFLQICAALSAAHAKGIIHRDLKPENVYLVEFLGDPDFVKLLDFGIAKLTEVNEGDRKLTRTGMLFGTPEYMSPEQARGEPHVDHRVDVYAMGCILFQLVTGRVPFEADNFMGVLSLHLTEPPAQIAPETFDRIGAPRGLAAVITRALEKDRNARFQSIDDFANAVRTVCGDPLPASGDAAKQPAPSVPAPGTITQPKPTPSPTGRVRTQWTGKVSVPVADDDRTPRPRPSRWPWIAGAAVVLAAGAVVAVLVTRDDSATPPAGGGGSQLAVTPDAATVAPPPPAIDAAPLPAEVVFTIESRPRGAEITDLATKSVLGKTPLSFKLTPSHTARQFALRMRGYNDAVVEVVPNQPKLAHHEKLVKGTQRIPAAGSATRPPDSPPPPPSVDAGSEQPPVEPPPSPVDAGAPQAPPPSIDAAPKGPKLPVDPGCLDDDDLTPCLKDPLGAGGGD